MTYPLGSLRSPASAATPGASSSAMPAAARPLSRWRLQLGITIGGALLVLWLIAMISHHPGDAAFSTSGDGQRLRNQAGVLGAWASDISYVVCGLSAWWGLVFGVRAWLSAVARLLRADLAVPEVVAPVHWRPWWLAWLGLTLLLMASAALEWTRLYQFEGRVAGAHAGGVLGAVLGPLSMRYLGFAGSGVLWIVTLLLGLAWALRFSWLGLAERIGALFDGWRVRRAERREVAEDKRIGEQAQRQREREVTGHGGLDDLPAPAPATPPQRRRKDKGGAAAAPVAPPAVEPVFEGLSAAVPSRLPPEPQLAPAALSGLAAEPADSIEFTDTVPELPPRSRAPWDDEVPPLPEPPVPAPSPVPVARAAVIPPPVAAAAAVAPVPGSGGAPMIGLPGVDLLDMASVRTEAATPEQLDATSRQIERHLKDFGVEVKVIAAMPGPVITRYEIEPATGVKGAQIVNLAKDLARSLSLVSIRVVETIPGRNCMALELPNARRQMIRLSEVLGAPIYQHAVSLLTLGLGKDIVGQPFVADLAKMPHCLVAGTTGSGKSVGINSMILSLLYKAEPADVRLILIDPKMLEMSVYEGIPHLLAPVVTDMKQAANALNWCVAEMERRYRLMSKLGVRNLAGYNKKIADAREREALYAAFQVPDDLMW